jgi:hypothetical protein
MPETNGKTIDVVIADFDKPGLGLPALSSGSDDVTCESAKAFYEALRQQGLTDADVNDYTLIQYDRCSGDELIQVRNACCKGDSCGTKLEDPEGTYCGPQAQEVKQRLALEAPGKKQFLLIIEKGAELEQSVRCVLQQLGNEGYQLNYRMGSPAKERLD